MTSDWSIHFQLISKTAEPNMPKLKWRQELNVRYHVCVFCPIRKQDGRSASDWLRHFRLLLRKCWTEFAETRKDARHQCPLWSLCFLADCKKITWPPRPRIGWDIFNFSETTEQNLPRLDRKQYFNVLHLGSVFQEKNKVAAQPLIGWHIFDFFSETAERNLSTLDSKHDLNVPYHVHVFLSRSEKQDDGLTSDWLRYFQLLWNR